MSRQWFHQVSPEWLKARKSVITATDVVKLIPEYKRYLKANNPDTIMPGFAALWAEKQTNTDLIVETYGAAARGHIMEPWAVQTWCLNRDEDMYHWDDCLIINNGIGFSPDALDIEQDPNTVVYDIAGSHVTMISKESNKAINQPKKMLEIKSYEPAHHMKSCLTDKTKHDELMQLAIAFIVCPTLEEATLVFFCPDAPIPMKDFSYTRKDLGEQIELGEKIIKLWEATNDKCLQLVAQSKEFLVECSEQSIYDDFLLNSVVDPVAQENVFLLKG